MTVIIFLVDGSVSRGSPLSSPFNLSERNDIADCGLIVALASIYRQVSSEGKSALIK